MNTNDLNMALYEKMAAEQDKYRDWLKSQPPEETLHHTYEYAIREDIVMAMEELELTNAQVQALLESPSPLADVYRYFEKLVQPTPIFLFNRAMASATSGSLFAYSVISCLLLFLTIVS